MSSAPTTRRCVPSRPVPSCTWRLRTGGGRGGGAPRAPCSLYCVPPGAVERAVRWGPCWLGSTVPSLLPEPAGGDEGRGEAAATGPAPGPWCEGLSVGSPCSCRAACARAGGHCPPFLRTAGCRPGPSRAAGLLAGKTLGKTGGRGLGFSVVTWRPSVTASLTSSLQDMFDPHGWTEDSYYEALGR